MKTEEDEEFERIEAESGWRKRQIALNQKAENACQMGLNYEQKSVAWEQFHEHMAGPNYVAPQRTWVGLTDEEIETLIHRFDGDPHTLLDEVNARLKEKNP